MHEVPPVSLWYGCAARRGELVISEEVVVEICVLKRSFQVILVSQSRPPRGGLLFFFSCHYFYHHTAGVGHARRTGDSENAL